MKESGGPMRLGGRVGQGAVVLALVMLFAPMAVAEDTDVVVLDNGKEIIGEVKDFLQGKLKFDTDQANKIYIEWDYVYFLTSSAFFEVYDENGAVYYGSLGTTDEKRQLVVTGEDGSVVLDMDTVVEFTPIEKSFVERLDGNIDLGLSYTSADSSFQYSLDAAAAYRQKKYSASIALNSIQTRREGVDDILRDNLTFDYTRYHWKRYFGTGTLEFSRNTELGIDLRTELGYAFGRYALVSNRHVLVRQSRVLGDPRRRDRRRVQHDGRMGPGRCRISLLSLPLSRDRYRGQYLGAAQHHRLVADQGESQPLAAAGVPRRLHGRAHGLRQL